MKPIPCVADNASSDRTPGVLWNAIDAGRLAVENVLWLHRNFGFAAAQNQLIRRLGSRNQYRWFATLNIDATADPKWLERLVDAASTAQDSRVGMWGGPILEPGGLRMSSAGHALRSDGAFMDVDRNREIDGRLVSNTSGFEPFGPCFAASLWCFSSFRRPDSPIVHSSCITTTLIWPTRPVSLGGAPLTSPTHERTIPYPTARGR